jgi:hypothetical protein
MTDTNKSPFPCPVCGKLPRVSKYPKPKDFVSIFGDTHPTKPFVSIQCGRHNNILVNVNASGDTIEKALDEAVKSWNEYYIHFLSPNAVVMPRDELNLIMKSLTAFVYETTHLSRCEENGSHKCVISAETLELGRICRALLSQYGERKWPISLMKP